jgi:hypothetical protein
MPRQAGALSTESGELLQAALLDPVMTASDKTTSVSVADSEAGDLMESTNLVTWLLIIALLLLSLEWFFYQKGRMP